MPETVPVYLILIAILLAQANVLLVMDIRRMRPGVACTIERFGRYRRTLGPGLHLLVPFIERIGKEIPTGARTVSLSRVEVETSDRFPIPLNVELVYQVVDVPKATYEVGRLEESTASRAERDLAAVVATVERTVFVRNREAFAESLAAWIQETPEAWDVEINAVTLTDAGAQEDPGGPEARRAHEAG